ncbi:tyrosine-type recombinase/integrase [Micromonospora globbae]|uniref:Site-specific integrase n=1 Tax=Micromonospora globbae TaxID=1894969 RepID=A0A420EEQ7_9ACTN|nr:site-specific integrase [Micromonospora globbae]RKF19148.1 site-specific integrase [Micromonospora globbae]
MSGMVLGGRDVAGLKLARIGRLLEDVGPAAGIRLIDGDGCEVGVVSDFLSEMRARGNSIASLRSYGMDLLRWFRFLWTVDVAWDRTTRVEARDFVLWMQRARKPGRGDDRVVVNPITGKRGTGAGYAPATINHAETVVRCFYDYVGSVGAGPVVNPFPIVSVEGGRRLAHHNPMQPAPMERTGLYRLKQPQRSPRSIPDGLFEQLFARLSCDRDRALVAMFVSTAARAAELLGLVRARLDIGNQLVGVVRKGTGAVQMLPASSDAFVWLRLYQRSLRGKVPTGPSDPVWWTVRPPYRPLNYHAARAVLLRANVALGTNWSWHDLRHTAAYRMAADVNGLFDLPVGGRQLSPLTAAEFSPTAAR